MSLNAHTPRSGGSHFHDLRKHSEDVAELAGRFGRKFGAEEAARLLGLVHDIGKAQTGFQKYLLACHQGVPARSCPHAYPGAAAVKRLLQDAIPVVQGHHAGLPDAEKSQESVLGLTPKELEGVKEAFAFAKTLLPSDTRPLSIPEGTEGEHLLRMLASALTDADYLDTERHFSGDVGRGDYPSVTTLKETLDRHLEALPSNDSVINGVRRNVQDHCRSAAKEPTGFFRLTVPTGGGKTLASVLFALSHAVQHNLDRVVIAIPYTSIIEQTADTLRKVFGDRVIVEHHSATELDNDANTNSTRLKLAAENWDCPIVVTTNVQLFESLLSNRPQRIRKLHNLARSVVILDEAQTLPPDLLEPCLDLLGWMVDHASTSVVFCTATQPSYQSIQKLPNALRTAREIIEPGPLFEALARVRYVNLGSTDHEAVAERMRRCDQVLCIANTRADSVKVFRALDDPQALYLSTYQYPDHRRRVIAQIRERLKTGQPCKVVSTQVVEAGVDLDFPYVLRAMAGLDSLVQAAGRCNRNGELPGLGLVEVFSIKGSKAPGAWYRTAMDCTERLLATRDIDRIDRPETQAEFFQMAYLHTKTDRVFCGTTIQQERQLRNFCRVATNSHFIDVQTTSAVVSNDDTSAVVNEALDDIQLGRKPREAFRRLQSVSVSLRDDEMKRQSSNLTRHASGVWLWTGRYDSRLGIGADDEYAPESLNV